MKTREAPYVSLGSNPPRPAHTQPPWSIAGGSDDDSFSDDSDPEARKPPKRRTSTPRGKERAAGVTGVTGDPWGETPASTRRNGGAGVDGGDGGGGESNPWESMAGLSLCQFWRYRLLLEVVLAARGGAGGQAGGREELGKGPERGGLPEPRLAEVRAAANARPKT